MKKLKKVKWIPHGLFPAYIGFCNTEKAWNKLMKRLNCKNSEGFSDSAGNCTTFENLRTGGLTVIISLNYDKVKNAKKSEAFAMLAHEAKHAHDSLMDHIREFKRDGEVSAYTIDWLVREGAKAFNL